MRYIAFLIILILTTACSQTGIKENWTDKRFSNTYAQFSLKTGEINKIIYASDKPSVDSNSVLFDFSSDQMVSRLKNYSAKACIDTYGLRNYNKNKGAWGGDSPRQCRYVDNFAASERSARATGFLAWLLVIPAIFGQMIWDIDITEDHVYSLYIQEKNKINIDAVNKNLVALKSFQPSVFSEIQEAGENYKMSATSRLKTIPKITNIINKTHFNKPSKIILEKKCILEKKRFDLSKTLASSNVNLLNSEAITDYKENIGLSLGFYRSMKPFGGFNKSSSASLLQSFGDHSGVDALTGFKYQQKCYISNDNKSISEITLLEKNIKTKYFPLTASANLISVTLLGDEIEVVNNSNSYIELAGYSVYKEESILSNNFTTYLSMPPKSVKTLYAASEFKQFEIVMDKSFYSSELPKSPKLGFAVSFYKEGVKKTLFKDKALAISYK
jgi:hypothetical protein